MRAAINAIKWTPVAVLLLIAQTLLGQTMPLTFSNPKNAYYNTANKNAFLPANINDITLNADSSFEFWSRPNISCFTWESYKGTWHMQKDTIFFYDNYEVEQADVNTTYNNDTTKSFRLHFSTDEKSTLLNRKITIEYVYDYDAHLEDPSKVFTIGPGNLIEIPFDEIPHLNRLASIRINYQLNFADKRYSYLTPNDAVNIKKVDLPNIIGVEFVENPKKEIVHRTIKAVIEKNILVIVSSAKNKTTLPDYYPDIKFEDSYALTK